MLECSVFVEDKETPSVTFKRFVSCNLYLGILDTNKTPHKLCYLCVVTAARTFRYRIFENIKRVINKELLYGKMCIEFNHPSHSVIVRCNNGKLPSFFRLFQYLADEVKICQLKRIPVIPTNLKFVANSKADTTESSVKEIISQIPSASLRHEILKNAQILHLPNSRLKNLPMQLGFLRWSEINLENNDLTDDNLSWLEELPIRKTLSTLNLSKNKITSFPAALVDYHCLGSVNLRDNQIQYIPGRIGSLQCLRNLNLSKNLVRYLPASIVDLKLDELDLTENYLTCSDPVKDIPPEREVLKPARLEDLASIKIDYSLRRRLSNKECPRRLLEKLRCLSQCVCGKKSTPLEMNEYFVPLPTVRFSSSFCTHPQKLVQKSGIFLQYHFCVHADKCDSKKFQRMSPPYYRLT